jgi:hypothetical protein
MEAMIRFPAASGSAYQSQQAPSLGVITNQSHASRAASVDATQKAGQGCHSTNTKQDGAAKSSDQQGSGAEVVLDEATLRSLVEHVAHETGLHLGGRVAAVVNILGNTRATQSGKPLHNQI